MKAVVAGNLCKNYMAWYKKLAAEPATAVATAVAVAVAVAGVESNKNALAEPVKEVVVVDTVACKIQEEVVHNAVHF